MRLSDRQARASTCINLINWFNIDASTKLSSVYLRVRAEVIIQEHAQRYSMVWGTGWYGTSHTLIGLYVLFKEQENFVPQGSRQSERLLLCLRGHDQWDTTYIDCTLSMGISVGIFQNWHLFCNKDHYLQAESGDSWCQEGSWSDKSMVVQELTWNGSSIH